MLNEAMRIELPSLWTGRAEVTGVKVDAHKIGLCSKARQAVVVGEVKGDRFVATKVEVK